MPTSIAALVLLGWLPLALTHRPTDPPALPEQPPVDVTIANDSTGRAFELLEKPTKMAGFEHPSGRHYVMVGSTDGQDDRDGFTIVELHC